ncbi:MAG: amidohydrolase family protein [Burkholderiales bacterium]|nr:amidohydrolase family protein [Burkholderiales bacterium]
MKIDMHAHWRPAALIDALRARSAAPCIRRNAAGTEVLCMGNAEEPLAQAFDDAATRLEEMDREGITTGVLSLLGSFSWIERLPAADGLPLARLANDSLSALCRRHPGRFAAYACVPLTDLGVAVAEFERAMTLPGMIGVQLPASGFTSRQAALRLRPLLEAANRRRAAVFVHWGPLPGEAWPHVGPETDNARRRNGTLDMQATLSSVMVTLCLTDLLDPFPEARVHVHNLGGNIPYEIERMDHRSLLDSPAEELPSKRFARAPVYVDCNSFGPRAIEAATRLYGADRIVFGTDGTAFGCQWSTRAVEEAEIGADARAKILHGNARRMLGHLVALGQAPAAAA